MSPVFILLSISYPFRRILRNFFSEIRAECCTVPDFFQDQILGQFLGNGAAMRGREIIYFPRDTGLDGTIPGAMPAAETAPAIGNVVGSAGKMRVQFAIVKDLKLLSRNGAVGDILLRFFDRYGTELDENLLTNHVISMSLSQLRNVERAIGIAGGLRKFEAIRGALRGRLINILVTDQFTAERLLND